MGMAAVLVAMIGWAYRRKTRREALASSRDLASAAAHKPKLITVPSGPGVRNGDWLWPIRGAGETPRKGAVGLALSDEPERVLCSERRSELAPSTGLCLRPARPRMRRS